jgi:hypothetical protein
MVGGGFGVLDSGGVSPQGVTSAIGKWHMGGQSICISIAVWHSGERSLGRAPFIRAQDGQDYRMDLTGLPGMDYDQR